MKHTTLDSLLNKLINENINKMLNEINNNPQNDDQQFDDQQFDDDCYEDYLRQREEFYDSWYDNYDIVYYGSSSLDEMKTLYEKIKKVIPKEHQDALHIRLRSDEDRDNFVWPDERGRRY